jgi:hypothetical protein
MGEDLKVKAAEGEEIVFEPDPLSGSPTTFTIYHGGFGGVPPGEGATDLIGAGHLTEGYVQPAPGTQVTFPGRSGGRPKPPPPTMYLAICFQQHAPDTPGVDANGIWTSGVLNDCQAAFSAAASHEHAVDRVEAITGPVGWPSAAADRHR